MCTGSSINRQAPTTSEHDGFMPATGDVIVARAATPALTGSYVRHRLEIRSHEPMELRDLTRRGQR